MLESESSGRSVSPTSIFASGSEGEIGDLAIVEPTASTSSFEESEWSIPTPGSICATSSVTAADEHHPTSSSADLLPGHLRPHSQVTLICL